MAKLSFYYEIPTFFIYFCKRFIKLTYMEKKRILFVSQEIAPFLPKSELSTIARKLPQGVQENGKEITDCNMQEMEAWYQEGNTYEDR